jgi:hypothetical protein
MLSNIERVSFILPHFEYIFNKLVFLSILHLIPNSLISECILLPSDKVAELAHAERTIMWLLNLVAIPLVGV